MTTRLFFASPADTTIAAGDVSFIEGLRAESGDIPHLTESSSAGSADIILVDERYEYRTWKYRDELLRCDFLRRHAERVCVINHDSYARVFLPGLYSSLESSRPTIVDAAAAPYKRDLWLRPVKESGEFNPAKLFTFRGTFHTHGVRRKICKALSRSSEGACEELRKPFHSHDANDQASYIGEIRNAAFSLCPRGLSPSSYRLYESLQLGRCPVVIADDWIPPDGPDWDSFLLKIPESHTSRLLQTMHARRDEAETLGKLAREAWTNHFSWPARYRTFLRLAIALHQQRSQHYRFNDLAELWHSQSFLRRYDWTLPARIRQRLSRTLKTVIDPPPS